MNFFHYSTVTGLVFAKVFIARPMGAAIFGHDGGRIGRSTLIATLLLMDGSEAVVAAISTARQLVHPLAAGPRTDCSKEVRGVPGTPRPRHGPSES